jgi:hypothetical protein
MKIRSTILILLLCLATGAAFSQKSTSGKPRIFAALPNSIDIAENILLNTFTAIPGETITLSFSDQFGYSGTVLSNEIKYANLQSVIIKSAAYQNSLFQLSKITNTDNSFTYVGRIVNPEAADGFEIKKENNSYRFQKIETEKIIQDCSY